MVTLEPKGDPPPTSQQYDKAVGFLKHHWPISGGVVERYNDALLRALELAKNENETLQKRVKELEEIEAKWNQQVR